MSLYTNNRNFHNVPIPYEFSSMSDLCSNSGHPYDGYVDFMILTRSNEERDMLLLDKLMHAETLIHCRIRCEHYNLKLSLCCITDHIYYRLYYTIVLE